MIEVNYYIKSKSWQRRILEIKQISKKVIKMSKKLKFNKNIDYFLNIILVNDKEMKKINKKYKNIKKTTDVLTFVSEFNNKNQKKKKYCDIFFSEEIINTYLKKNKLNFYDHFTHLLVHSFLHINGFTHITEVNFQRMKNIEIKILNNLGLSNPYTI